MPTQEQPPHPHRPLPERIRQIIDRKADKYGVDASLARAVAWVESRGNPNAQSGAGAIGVMQLMPVTIAHLNVQDPWQPDQNIDAGIRMLRNQAIRRDCDLRQKLAAYNYGPGHVNRDPEGTTWPARTHQYIANVLERRDIERRFYDAPSAGLCADESGTPGAPGEVAPPPATPTPESPPSAEPMIEVELETGEPEPEPAPAQPPARLSSPVSCPRCGGRLALLDNGEC